MNIKHIIGWLILISIFALFLFVIIKFKMWKDMIVGFVITIVFFVGLALIQD